MQSTFKDLESLQLAYDSTFNNTSYDKYLQRCIDRKIPYNAIKTKEEYEKENESSYEDEESYLTPKPKMTEEEAMEWFSDSDNFHQLFHKFMQQQKYVEKEVNGKQFWIKSK